MASDMGGEAKCLEGMYKRSPDSTRAGRRRKAQWLPDTGCVLRWELRGTSSRAAFYGDLTSSSNGKLPRVPRQPSQGSRRPIFLTPFPLVCSFRADARLRLGVLAYAAPLDLDPGQQNGGTRS